MTVQIRHGILAASADQQSRSEASLFPNHLTPRLRKHLELHEIFWISSCHYAKEVSFYM
jgi:hypothetical protein